jgi:hypothetical protein
MSDDADIASADDEMLRAYREAAVRAAAAEIPAGEAGECIACGEWSGRLVGGACAPCRDRYRLP